MELEKERTQLLADTQSNQNSEKRYNYILVNSQLLTVKNMHKTYI